MTRELPPHIILDNSINVMIDNRMRIIDSTHINYRAIRAWFEINSNSSLDELRRLVDIPSFIAQVTEGRVQVGDGEVRFDDKPIHGVISDRLVAMLRDGLPIQPLARFLDNLMNNPLETARDELYLWLEESKMPITPDGHFLAFKKVRSDFASYWDSRVSNKVGDVVEMDRDSVDPNRHQTCSAGLHFCSWSYLPHYCGNQGKVVVVKINPADVVAIPSDYDNAKGRTWRYLVVGEVPEDECKHLFRDVHVTSSSDWDWASGWNDEHVDDEDEFEYNYNDNGDSTEHDWCVDPDDADYDGLENADIFTSQKYTSEPILKHKNVEYVLTHIKYLVGQKGQRGAARHTGIPRSTIQDFLKRNKDN